LKKEFKNLTRPATLHLIFPVLTGITTANSSVNKPAKTTCLKFPGRAFFLGLRETFFYNPAWISALLVFLNSG